MNAVRRKWKPRREIQLGRYTNIYRDAEGILHISVELQPVTVMTVNAVRSVVTYRADGDYQDRWFDRYGNEVEVAEWSVPRRPAS